jgi:hypothetical protein
LLAFNYGVCQVEMQAKMAAPVLEGEQQKSVVEIVAEVLTKDCPSSTFLMNAGL